MDCKRGTGAKEWKRLIPMGALHVQVLLRSATSAAAPTHSSLWPTLCVQDCSPSPTPSSPIALSYTPLPQPLPYLPPLSMPSKIRATFTPWPSTSQRAARAFWSAYTCICLSILTFLSQILANFSLLLSLMCGRLVQQLFFGSLRAVEVEVGLQILLRYRISLALRDSTTACGSLSPSRFWHSPFSETRLISLSLSCSAFYCLSSLSTGSCQTGSNGYVSCHCHVSYSPSADESNAVSRSNNPVSCTNQRPILPPMDHEHRDVGFCRREYCYQRSRRYHSLCKRGQWN